MGRHDRRYLCLAAGRYTRELLAAVPRIGSGVGRQNPGMRRGFAGHVAGQRLHVRFDLRGGIFGQVTRRVHAVEGVSFFIAPNETLALVGESGCGKSTTAKALAGLVPYSGDIVIGGRNLSGLGRDERKAVRRDVQMIFQDPFASLNPRMRVGDLVAEPLVIHGIASKDERRDRVAALFERVGLSADQMELYPHEFSGGQRQRVCIARALALRPKLIIADESVSALDVSVQARVLDLLKELQREFGVAISSSRTTWRWSNASAIGLRSCISARSSRWAPATRCFPARATPIRSG